MADWPAGRRVMVTGHRSIRGERADLVRGVLAQLLEKLAARHPDGLVAVCGMAVGVDIEFADAALGLGLPLVAAVPIEDQEGPWPVEAKARYWRVLARAVLVVSVWKEPGYGASEVGAKMHARNRWMIDHSDLAIAIWDGRRSGGTWAAVHELLRRGRKVLVVDPRTGNLRVEVTRPRDFAKSSGFGTAYGMIKDEYAAHGVPVEEGSVLDMFARAAADGLDSARYVILATRKAQRLDDDGSGG